MIEKYYNIYVRPNGVKKISVVAYDSTLPHLLPVYAVLPDKRNTKGTIRLFWCDANTDFKQYIWVAVSSTTRDGAKLDKYGGIYDAITHAPIRTFGYGLPDTLHAQAREVYEFHLQIMIEMQEILGGS
jgi:hypothetical protein